MFSKRSVSVQPSAPPMEYAVTPEAFSVLAASSRSSQVAGGSTPASWNALTLYQTVDLLAPLKTKPYRVPSMVPRSIQSGPKFCSTTLCA